MKSLKVATLLAFASIRKGNAGVILLTIMILVLITLNLLFVPSLFKGLVSGANDQVKNTYSADIIIDSEKENGLIWDADHLLSRIKSVDGVVAATSRNSLMAEMAFESEHTSGRIYGIYPEQEKAIFTIADSMIEGSYLDANDNNGIVLGIQLAGADRPNLEFYSRSLREVHAGDKITVTYPNGFAKRYTVRGIFYTEFLQTDLFAFVNEKELDAVNPLFENQAAFIHVKIAPGADAASIVAQISKFEDKLRVLTWEDYAGIVRSLTDSFNVINTILNIVNLLVAGITVFIVTYIDVANRRRQIGVQRAIGVTASSITIAYLMRAIFYAILAIILAAFIFINAVVPLEARFPFHFPFGNVYLHMELSDMVRVSVILLSVALVAAFVPVRNVMRIKILDAIWG